MMKIVTVATQAITTNIPAETAIAIRLPTYAPFPLMFVGIGLFDDIGLLTLLLLVFALSCEAPVVLDIIRGPGGSE
jgi:hypothetical protein